MQIFRSAIVLAFGITATGTAGWALEHQQTTRPKRPASVSRRFVLNCNPFGTIAQAHPIDRRCNQFGLRSGNSLAQHEAQNNLWPAPTAAAVDRVCLRP